MSSHPAAIPILDTARLRLRGHRREDLDACCALWSDPDVVRYIGGQPSPRDVVWLRLTQYVGHWVLQGFGYWLVEERASGRVVGEVGAADFLREVEPSIAGVPEAGWVIAPWAQGRGYASEALAVVLAWLEAERGDPEVACLIDPANAPSLRVAAKADFREEARTVWRGHDSVIFRRPPRGRAP